MEPRLDNYERIYIANEPVVDEIEHTRFDLRAPHNSHMSTVAYLEREYTIEFQKKVAHKFTAHTILDGFEAEINSPGFALQNCISKAHSVLMFNTTSVSEHPDR